MKTEYATVDAREKAIAFLASKGISPRSSETTTIKYLIRQDLERLEAITVTTYFLEW